MISRFKKFRDNLREVSTVGTAEIAREVVGNEPTLKELAIRLNQEQILAGFDSKGNPTGSYAKRTVTNRAKRGLQTAHKDYRFTGNFFRKFYVVVVPFLGAIFKIDSTDSKRNKIIKGSGKTPAAGPDLFGLNEKNLEVFKSTFQPKFITRLKNALRIK